MAGKKIEVKLEVTEKTYINMNKDIKERLETFFEYIRERDSLPDDIKYTDVIHDMVNQCLNIAMDKDTGFKTFEKELEATN